MRWGGVHRHWDAILPGKWWQTKWCTCDLGLGRVRGICQAHAATRLTSQLECQLSVRTHPPPKKYKLSVGCTFKWPTNWFYYWTVTTKNCFRVLLQKGFGEQITEWILQKAKTGVSVVCPQEQSDRLLVMYPSTLIILSEENDGLFYKVTPLCSWSHQRCMSGVSLKFVLTSHCDYRVNFHSTW